MGLEKYHGYLSRPLAGGFFKPVSKPEDREEECLRCKEGTSCMSSIALPFWDEFTGRN